jgi:hypothetical protein
MLQSVFSSCQVDLHPENARGRGADSRGWVNATGEGATSPVATVPARLRRLDVFEEPPDQGIQRIGTFRQPAG